MPVPLEAAAGVAVAAAAAQQADAVTGSGEAERLHRAASSWTLRLALKGREAGGSAGLPRLFAWFAFC